MARRILKVCTELSVAKNVSRKDEGDRTVPTYEYSCNDCGDRLDVVQSFTDNSLTVCPTCGGQLRKLFGNVGVVFKGSGFYRNDSRAGANQSGDQQSGDTARQSGDTDQQSATKSDSSEPSSADKGKSDSSDSKAADSGSGDSGSGDKKSAAVAKKSDVGSST